MLSGLRFWLLRRLRVLGVDYVGLVCLLHVNVVHMYVHTYI